MDWSHPVTFLESELRKAEKTFQIFSCGKAVPAEDLLDYGPAPAGGHLTPLPGPIAPLELLKGGPQMAAAEQGE